MLNVEYLVTRTATQNYTPTFLSALSRYKVPLNNISDKIVTLFIRIAWWYIYKNLNVYGIVIHRAYRHTCYIY